MSNQTVQKLQSAAPTSASTALHLLESALRKENEFYQQQQQQTNSNWGLQTGEGLVTATERDDTVRWLCRLARSGTTQQAATGRAPSRAPSSALPAFASDTLNLAVCFLDVILSGTRVQSKYLQCLALASLNLAAKLCEEPESVPSTTEWCRMADARYSIPELMRMERVLLSRLQWRLSYPTVDEFLQLMLAVSFPQEFAMRLMCKCEEPGDLRCLMETVFTSHQFHAIFAGGEGFRPSVLALTLLSLTLEAQRYPHWLSVTLNLHKQIKVDSDVIIKCRERVLDVLGAKEASLRQKRSAGGKNKENLPLGGAWRGSFGKSPRKRHRQRSKGSDSGMPKTKTPPEKIFIDEIADAVHALYGPGAVVEL